MVIELDSVEGEWQESSALVDSVAVVPAVQGDYRVFMNLPQKVRSNWRVIVAEYEDRSRTPNCRVGAERAYEFYRSVWQNMQEYGW